MIKSLFTISFRGKISEFCAKILKIKEEYRDILTKFSEFAAKIQEF